ncbi:Ppx/GppA phosphatase family protein [Oricola sp.]|uniref:Ppx/GppA phosphatase family protein n=1 Tax=Oricola sp. TaxID=1979950 RepID=UPI003BA93115
MSDASASGSEPSGTGGGSKGTSSSGARGKDAGSASGSDNRSAGKAAEGGDSRNGPESADVRNGSFDHHKEKRGRKRRRRRRTSGNGQANAAATDANGDAGQRAPAPRETVGRRRRRRGKPQSATAAERQREGQQTNPAGEQRPPNPAIKRRSPELYAALDLGTNNCRLLVATPTRPGQFRVVDAFSRIVRLGEGLSRTGRLGDDAMDRAVEALQVCRDKLKAREVRRARLIATEACRSAHNGVAFLDRVRAETGLDLEIVDRETEARLAVSGCSSLVGRETNSVVLFDIGGGSSEIALVDVRDRRSRRLSDHIVAWTSLPIGVVTLSEKFGGHRVTEQSFADMVDHAAELLTLFDERDRLSDRVGLDGFHLLGTSGTVTTLAGIHLDLPRYDRRRVDGLWMSAEEVDAMNARLLSWSFEERVANPCIGADRADLVLAGCAILEAIRRAWPSKRLRVADRGLREGLLTEMMAADGVWRRGVNPWRNRSRRSGQ